MLRINRSDLDKAVEALCICARTAKSTMGLRVLYPLTSQQAEAAVLAVLSMHAPSPGLCMADDVYLIHDFGGPQSATFPPQTNANA